MEKMAVVRILSRASTFDESEDEESLVKRSKIEKKLNLRRILKLLTIVLVFLVVAIIFLFCVAYEVKRQEDHLEEIICAANDADCLGNLCPVGMVWKAEEDQCAHEVPVNHHGMMINNPANCRCGYVYVEWRGRCMRRSGAPPCR